MTKLELHRGDCLEILPKIKAKSVDVCIYSPPYNIGTQYHSYYDKRSEAAYLDFMYRVAAQAYRILKDDGALFLNLGHVTAKPLLPYRVAALLTSLFKLQNVVVWVKSITVGADSRGHFKPINSQRYLNNNCEYIFHFSKTGDLKIDRLAIGVPYKDKSNIARRGHSQDKRCRGSAWFIPYPTRKKKLSHPATYPTKLPLWCIKLHGKSRPRVLDPFMGLGATGIAALRCDARKFIGIELDKKYFRTARRRLHKRRQ